MMLRSFLLRFDLSPDHSFPLPLWPGAHCLQIAVDVVYLVSDLSEESKQKKPSDNIRALLRKRKILSPFEDD